jgi:hypothetical protein
MKTQLKKAIIDFIFDNEKDVQLHNATIEKFKLYIFDGEGEYLIGGDDVLNFINQAINLCK